MTDIKVRLKRIKELIEGQEWQKAWDISERILSEDPNNLPARLFMGKAAMELDKPERAIECFRSVAKTQPDQIAAWQGVIVFYAKYKQVAEQSDELTEAYRRCLDHLGNDEKLKPKIIEYLLGYCRQLTLKGEIGELQPMLERLIQLATGFTFKEARVEGRQKLIRLILPKKYETDLSSLTQDQVDLLLSTFEELLSEYDQTSVDQNYPQEHLNFLLRLSKNDQADHFARNYIERFDAHFGVACILMAVLKRSLVSACIAQPDQADWTMQEKMAAIELQHPLVRIAKAFQFFLERNYRKSSELLEKALSPGKGISSLSPAYRLPLMEHIELHSKKLLGISLICLADVDSVRKGLALLKEVAAVLKDWEVFFYQGYAQVELLDVAAAEETLLEGSQFLKDHQHSTLCLGALAAFLALQKKDYEQAETLSERALMLAEKNHLFHYIFFRSLWDNRRRDPRRCISHLNRSIELYSGFGLPHLYLGFYIWRENSDTEAAKEEYEVAYNLLPTDVRVIRGYTDFCTLNHQDERAMEIIWQSLQSVSLSLEDGRWMRLRLALLCYRNKLWHQCIANLRHILRSHPDDRLVEEFLADALTFRGNFWSAAGIFEEVVKSAESRGEFAEYSRYRLACLRQKLQMDEQAEADFLLVKKESSWFGDMCLISLAEIELRKAKKAFKMCLPVIGVECCQKALDFLSEAVSLNTNLPITWSLLGDACLLMRYVRPGNTVLLINQSLWDGSEQRAKIALNIRQVLYLATIFYGVAIDLKRTSCRLWERLAVSYFFLAKRVESAGDVEASRNWRKRALLAVREMLQRNPYNPWVWHTAGFIVGASSHSKELDACRLYTKAIDLFRHFDLNPTVMAATWTAMGFLYVNKKRYFAANTLLTRGQNADPKLPEPWMGQAWCAERMGHLIEAMDLCRHACSLGLAKEAMRRYAEWVIWLCHNHDKIVDKQLRWAVLDRLDSVPTAINHLLQYIQVCEEDVKVCMALSLLLEWNGLTRSALDWSQKALASTESSESRFADEGAQVWTMAKLNTARLLCENGGFKESLAILETIETEPTLGMVLLLALVHFHLANFKQALSMLDVASDMTEEGHTKASLQIAIAAVHFFNGRVEEASALAKLALTGESLPARSILQAKLVLSMTQPEEVSQSEIILQSPSDCNALMENLSSTMLLSIILGKEQEKLAKTIDRFVHLQPTRIDFRLCQILASGGQSDTVDEQKNACIRKALLDLVPLADSNQPARQFWDVLVNCGQKIQSINEKSWHVALQKALHFFPYEVSYAEKL